MNNELKKFKVKVVAQHQFTVEAKDKADAEETALARMQDERMSYCDYFECELSKEIN